MMRLTSTLLCLALWTLLLGSARADLVFVASLDGTQEVPFNASPGSGTATVTLDTVTDEISVTLSWNSLLAGVTAADINNAPPGLTGPLVVSLALGNGTGTTDGSIDPSPQTVPLTATQVTDLEDGNDYVNVSTSQFVAGEIRGQLLLIPEPASLTLAGMGLSFALLGRGWHRRRRRDNREP